MGRSIVTSVKGQLSPLQPAYSGVPQGSVLGPLLFILYVSTLPAAVHRSTTAMFADDNVIYNVNCNSFLDSGNDCCALKSDTNRVFDRFQKRNTLINAEKSNEMVFCRCSTAADPVSHAPQPISLGSSFVRRSSSVRHLGVTISSLLNWSPHINSLLRSVGWKVALMKRLAFRARLSLCPFSLFYKSLVRTGLEYASGVWDGSSVADSRSLERVQLSLARTILSANLGSSCVTHLSKSQLLLLVRWPTLSWRRRRQTLFYFWKLKTGNGPPSLFAKLPASVSDRCS